MRSKSTMTTAFIMAALLGFLTILGPTTVVRAHEGEVEVVFLGNMGFKFTTLSGKIILTDPWLSGPDSPFGVGEIGDVDLILVGTSHPDNLGDTVEIAINTGATVIATAELAAWIISQGVPQAQMYPMMQGGRCGKPDAPDDPCAPLGISVKVVQAVHTAGVTIPGEIPKGYGGEAIGFIITFENDLRLYFSGDTGLFGDMKLFGELYKPHVAILSAAGRVMMEPEDAALATKFLRKKNHNLRTIIPAHHRINAPIPGLTGTPEKVAVEVKKLGLPVTVLDLVPGVPQILRKRD